MANPELTTYGSGKYTGLMMAHAGAVNVAAATIQGFKTVAMEQVIAWNPQVIFVQDRYPSVVNEIKTGAQWQTIDAVKNQRVYLMPDYAKAWGYPMPEAMGIGELWMAKKLYPEKFKDVDMRKVANDWYQRFYRTTYQGID
jgi:iron complex transport system substrate-binding protein